MMTRTARTGMQGVTLVELIVVMAIFMTVIIITSYAFQRISSGAGQQARSAESQIAGIVGIEVLRSDLQHAGYALPWSFGGGINPAAYLEVNVPVGETADGIDANTFNDAPSGVPRAIVSGTSSTTGTDYLVVKSTIASMKTAPARWAMVNYSSSASGNSSYIQKWNNSDDLADGDRVITLRDLFSQDSGEADRQLVLSGGSFYYAVNGQNPPEDFRPVNATDHFVAYVIDDADNLRMPFNRADYFVATPEKMPQACAPGTGVLYKGVARHSDGGIARYPLLECVGDMQVMYDLDVSGSGGISNADSLAGLTAQQIRGQLKTVRVYLLTHEGKKDLSYTYPVNNPDKAVVVGMPSMPSLGRVWKSADMASRFGADWRKYRWKVQSVVVRPDNLN